LSPKAGEVTAAIAATASQDVHREVLQRGGDKEEGEVKVHVPKPTVTGYVAPRAMCMGVYKTAMF